MPVLGYERMTSQDFCQMSYGVAPEYMLPAPPHMWDKHHENSFSGYVSRTPEVENHGVNMTYNSEGLLTYLGSYCRVSVILFLANEFYRLGQLCAKRNEIYLVQRIFFNVLRINHILYFHIYLAIRIDSLYYLFHNHYGYIEDYTKCVVRNISNEQ